jgi:hypothetical protein
VPENVLHINAVFASLMRIVNLVAQNPKESLMSKAREWFYAAIGIVLCISLVIVANDKPDPVKTVVVHDNKPTTGCSLPIKVGDYGFIKKGALSNLKAKVIGKVDNGVDCAYSVYIQAKKQDDRYYA